MSSNESAIEELLHHIRYNQDSILKTLEADPRFVRDFMAENHIEITPQECRALLQLLSIGLDIISDD